ncbi:Uncharacterized protein Fot_35363 [Forsythia ovata]|uniref:Uncharacterized protein n=1 Tax=Forsythia ovata TaxID=205694 RepID=A0ABD1SLA7_9LAMI
MASAIVRSGIRSAICSGASIPCASPASKRTFASHGHHDEAVEASKVILTMRSLLRTHTCTSVTRSSLGLQMVFLRSSITNPSEWTGLKTGMNNSDLVLSYLSPKFHPVYCTSSGFSSNAFTLLRTSFLCATT